MSPDTRNLLIVVGVGATIGITAVPAPHRTTAPVAPVISTPAQVQQAAIDTRPTGLQSASLAETNNAEIARLLERTSPAHRAAMNEGNVDSSIGYHPMTLPHPTYGGSAVAGPTVPMPTFSASPSSIDHPSAARRFLDQQAQYQQPASPQVNERSFGNILTRVGPNQYFDAGGNTYTPAGTHGVINNRTGEFSPTN